AGCAEIDEGCRTVRARNLDGQLRVERKALEPEIGYFAAHAYFECCGIALASARCAVNWSAYKLEAGTTELSIAIHAGELAVADFPPYAAGVLNEGMLETYLAVKGLV